MKGKHSWLMMICCAIPLVGIILLPLLGVKLGGAWPLLFVLACPLSMIFMMGSMGRNHSGHGGHGEQEEHEPSCHAESASRSTPAPRALPSSSEKQ